MNVLFVSQCTKRALTETRRILDQFAERRGERTWQTSITQAGLDAVRKLLRKTARKNTAVACHWIRGRDHSELLWVVGDGKQFNDLGAVPTNTTARNIRRAEDERTWHSLPTITALSALAALLHDLGKATQSFQERLSTPNLRERNHYRHEWVSVRLFQAFVGDSADDSEWLGRLAHAADDGVEPKTFETFWLDRRGGRLICDGLDVAETADPFHPLNPFRRLPPLAQAVAWLVLTHHRLPCKPVRYEHGNHDHAETADGTEQKWRRFGAQPGFIRHEELEGLLAQIHADWNEPRNTRPRSQITPYWTFPHGLPVARLAWRKQAARYANRLLQLAPTSVQAERVLHDPFTMHVSRLCLMLADHHYSRLGLEKNGQPVVSRKPYVQTDARLAANTVVSDSGTRVLNQSLDEHLLGVQAHASLITHSLPSLAQSLPALRHHRGLRKRTGNPRFQWQDKATDLATSVRERAASQGCFVINMASTGCGKTLGNARIMNALADPALGMRCAFAIGLRTLTLQTGRSFQNDLGLGDDQLAIKVGGAASHALFEYWEQHAESSGSASTQSLLDEGGQVLFEGHDQHPLLERLSDDPQVHSLLAAPLLVCTVDHLTPATESLRGGRQITPMLRLMTGDLVLDEPDDFDLTDLPALTRLVHWAGLLGSRVLLSSATLPPSLVEGLFQAYRAGRAIFQRHRSARPDEPLAICCLWIDEFNQTAADCYTALEFRDAHGNFVNQRTDRLAQAEIRRLAQIQPLPGTWSALNTLQRRHEFARLALQTAWELHSNPIHHGCDPTSGKRISFGLIRMANIEPLFDVALAMLTLGAPGPNVQIHLCVYHSQFPLLSRSVIEHQLDELLNRRPLEDGSDPVFCRPAVRALIDSHTQQDQMFIVLGSPVTEVGRDHDYDWAVVEPSSMRSLIQLAGRVRRHRPGAVEQPNIRILDSNLRAFEHNDKAAYCRPGFEADPLAGNSQDAARHFHLDSHQMAALLSRELPGGTPWPMDSRPRIASATKAFNPRRHLADLEHARLHDTMLPRAPEKRQLTPVSRAASLHWTHPEPLWLTGVLPQLQRFRHDPKPRVDVAMLPDDDEARLLLHRVTDGDRKGHQLYVCIHEMYLSSLPIQQAATGSVSAWMQLDLLQELAFLADHLGISVQRCAERFATASLADSTHGWHWHEVLGFTRKH